MNTLKKITGDTTLKEHIATLWSVMKIVDDKYRQRLKDEGEDAPDKDWIRGHIEFLEHQSDYPEIKMTFDTEQGFDEIEIKLLVDCLLKIGASFNINDIKQESGSLDTVVCFRLFGAYCDEN